MYIHVKKGLDKLQVAGFIRIIHLAMIAMGYIVIFLSDIIAKSNPQLASVILKISLYSVYLMILATILGIIFDIIGILQASKDVPRYNNAFLWCVLFAILLVASLAATYKTEFVWALTSSILGAGAGFSLYMVVNSIINATLDVADDIGNTKLYDMGINRLDTLKKIYIVVVILIFLNFIPIIGGVFLIMGYILHLIAYMYYLKFIVKARKRIIRWQKKQNVM